MDGVPDLPDQRPVRPQDMRAADADREQVLDRLRQAHVEGRLDTDELDERITATFAAKTYGQLAVITEDLPVAAAAPLATTAEKAPAEPDSNAEFRQAVTAWLGISVLTLSIWGVTCIATGTWIYPWFIWASGPWGAVLAMVWLAQRRKR